ncbi:MAG: HEAT repeat domain-containing protein [Bacteroidia bacterium]|nr:HEAT repeat domain-containing protein [Bacteroidia bacterium]
MKGKLTASQIYDLMVDDPGSAEGRDAAIEALEFLTPAEKGALRDRIVNASVAGTEDNVKFENPVFRGYLLGQLGRIAGDDADARKLMQSHVSPDKESDHWVRFWALSGCFRANLPNLGEIASWVVSNIPLNNPGQDYKLVLLAHAILEYLGKDPQAGHLDYLGRGLTDWLSMDPNLSEADQKLRMGRTQDALRVLGIVPQPKLTAQVTQILDEGKGDPRLKFLACQALGNIPEVNRAESMKAAKSLISFLDSAGNNRVLMAIREEALKALAVLKDPEAEYILMHTLRAGSLNLIQLASRALGNTLGIQVAVQRILEAAAKDINPNTRKNYAIALRWMEDDKTAVAEALDQMINSGNLQQQENARMLLAEMGGAAAMDKLAARNKVIEDYKSMLLKEQDSFQELFDKTMKEARQGFKIAIGMDVAVFGLGVLILVVTSILALVTDGGLDRWTGAGAGGAGVLSIVYGTLIANPRKKVFRSVNALMNFKVVFLAYLRQLHQTDQAFTRNMLEDDGMTPEEVSDYSKLITEMLREAVEKMVKLKNQELKEKTVDYKYEIQMKGLDVKQRMAEVKEGYGRTTREAELEDKLKRLQKDKDNAARQAGQSFHAGSTPTDTSAARKGKSVASGLASQAAEKGLAPNNWDNSPY